MPEVTVESQAEAAPPLAGKPESRDGAAPSVMLRGPGKRLFAPQAQLTTGVPEPHATGTLGAYYTSNCRSGRDWSC
jgi:hypothetical protein